MMTMQVENRLLSFWMDILPELDYDQKKLDEHLKKYLSIDTNQAIQEYYFYENSNVNRMIKEKCKNGYIEGINNQLFFEFFQQFILLHDSQLSNIIQQNTLISDKIEFQTAIHRVLYKRLFAQGYLVLVNELNLYRQNHQLKGATEEEQFDYFCSELITSEKFLITLENEYPLFLEGLSKTVETTIYYIQEIIENTKKYAQELEEYFSFRVEKSLNEIEFMGDFHNSGKSVCTLIFKSGKLIYKPKSLKTEMKFQNLLNYINNKITDSALYEMKIYTNDNHGWAEFIPHKKCQTLEEVKLCYKRTGKLLALLYSLNGVDFHYENVIFKGEFPVLVDLETLFSVPVKDSLSSSQSAFIKASNLLRDSVLSVGLLPTKMKLSENNAVSVGVLDAAQSYEVTAPSLVHLGSSKMKINMSKKQIFTQQNSITIDEKYQKTIDFLSFINDGFIEIYQWIVNNQKLFENLVFDLFKDCQVRIVVKPTMVYSQLISAANHPDFLTRDIHRKIVFSRVGLMSENEMITKNEIYELERNDILYFFARFNKKNLYSFSNKVIKSVLYDSPKGNFHQKIRLFSEEDLKRQLNFIDVTFFKKEADNELTPINKGVDTNQIDSIDPINYKKMAARIGNILKKQAIFGENDKKQKEVVWLDTNVANMDIEDWAPEVTSYDLYNGLSGLAIFYMNLAKVSNNEKNNLIIQTIIEMLKTYIISTFNKKGKIQSGIMTGLSGIFLTIFEYSHMYQSEKDEKFVEDKILGLQEIIAENNPIDYVSGNVGVLALMIKIIKKTNNRKLEKKCRNIADLMILDFKEKKTVLFKPEISDNSTIYSGFSHGLSGLITYLYEYYKLTNKKNVYQLFKECLEYQRTIFWCSEELDWFVSDREQKFSYGWCHGSPGILIEKINLKKLGYIDELIDKEIIYASNKLIENLGANISMCHGDLGNLLILQRFAKLEKNEKARVIVKNATNSIYQFIDENLESESKIAFKNFKGLLLGIAGVGDFMLKSYIDDNGQELIEYLW